MSTEGLRSRERLSLTQVSPRYRFRQAVGATMQVLMALAAALSTAVLVLIIGYVMVRGLPALNLAFFIERPLPIGEVGGGVAPAIIGSLLMVAGAGLIGIPIAVATAIYLSEYGNGRLASIIRFSLDQIAGLPSIVIGVVVWAVLVRRVIGNFAGLAGAIALAIIMVPIITKTVEETLRLVPNSLREASLALGVPRWKTILMIVLPTARAGIITAVVLSLARAGGETAPLLLTSLGNQFFNLDLMQPMAALPVQIYNYAISPYDDWHAKAWGGSLVLIALIGSLSLLARWAVKGRRLG